MQQAPQSGRQSGADVPDPSEVTVPASARIGQVRGVEGVEDGMPGIVRDHDARRRSA